MRCAILVVAACALAGALAVPIEKSSDNAVSRKGEVLAEFSDNSLEGQSEEGGLSTKERIRQKIVELRDAIASATSDLAKIIWQQAMDHGGKLSESLAIAREKVVKRLKELKDELLVKIREAMIPDDDVPVTYVIDEIFEQIIDGLKEQISEALKTMSDWHNLLTESGRAKIAEAKKRITELAQKIADTIREWRRAKDSATTTESSNYNSDPFYNDQLMIKLKELLEDLKVQLEINMLQRSGSNIEEEQESMIDFEEVDTQVTESLDSVRKMFEEATGMDVSPYNIIANLRKLLLRRMQELESLIRANADAKTIKMLETEILSLRRRLIEAVQEVFQRSSS